MTPASEPNMSKDCDGGIIEDVLGTDWAERQGFRSSSHPPGKP
jgi:hypothetical protein